MYIADLFKEVSFFLLKGASRRTRNSSLSSIGSHHTSAESGLERSMSRKSSRNRRSVDR